MKKINYRKFFVSVLWIIVIAGLTVCLGFVSKREKHIVAKKLNVSIHNNDENFFLTERDIHAYFDERRDLIVSNEYKNIDVPMLEKALNAHPVIENAEVSYDLLGNIKVDVTQRTPVVRIINKDGESYYIDSQSKPMPLNDNYTARVLVANGEIFEPYARRFQFTVNQIKKNKLFSEVSLLDDILDVATYINKDSSLTTLIQQIYINKDKEIELFPAIGNHRIVFGDAQNLNEKFNKLKLFYTEGLNKSDAWTKYAIINLKYKNLVVCTKIK